MANNHVVRPVRISPLLCSTQLKKTTNQLMHSTFLKIFKSQREKQFFGQLLERLRQTTITWHLQDCILHNRFFQFAHYLLRRFLACYYAVKTVPCQYPPLTCRQSELAIFFAAPALRAVEPELCAVFRPPPFLPLYQHAANVNIRAVQYCNFNVSDWEKQTAH